MKTSLAKAIRAIQTKPDGWLHVEAIRAEFHGYLKRSVRSASFLTNEQRRDIFYNKAARFLRIRPAEGQ